MTNVIDKSCRQLGSILRFWRPEASSHLRAEIVGERSLPVAIVRRAFPQSDPGQYLSIQGADGIEIGILKSIDVTGSP